MISKHLDKNNLHHAYLIEGRREEIVLEILTFCEDLNIKTSGNPDFCYISINNFKIDNAFDLRAMSSDKSFSSAKKIFVICANSFSLDAQNVLLRIFEEPIKNTHFFVVVPDANSLLKTLVSRFYFIKAAPTPQGVGAPTENVGEKFISMSLTKRLDFIKELLVEPDEEDIIADSIKSKALVFLNSLETTLHSRAMSKRHFDIDYFDQILKVRKYLRQPGSSAKTLMESVALIIPVL